MTRFPGRVGLQQRVLPAYRAPFFEALAAACEGGLGVFAGQPLPEESVVTASRLQQAQYTAANNRHIFEFRSALYHCWQTNIRGWLESWQPEILVVEANPRCPSTRLAVRWMHARGRPVLGWGLGAPEFSRRRSKTGLANVYRQWQRKSLLMQLDGLISYSQRGGREYQMMGFPPEKIYPAPNAVAPRPVKPPPDRPPAFGERARLLFVGRLQSRKRIDNLLWACAALPKDRQPELWIVGDGPARVEFEALAKNVYPHAKFAGAIHGAELEPFFEAADLFVLPGTGGLAVQQAMAYGLPVIVAAGDGTQDDLVRKENGWKVPAGDKAALLLALQDALSDAARLRRMGRASFQVVSHEINLEAMVAGFVHALRCTVDAASEGT